MISQRHGLKGLFEVFLMFFLFLFTFLDECFEVEQQCQHLISEIERVLGEPLQKYF